MQMCIEVLGPRTTTAQNGANSTPRKRVQACEPEIRVRIRCADCMQSITIWKQSTYKPQFHQAIPESWSRKSSDFRMLNVISLEIITLSVHRETSGQTLNQSLKSRSNDPPLILDEACDPKDRSFNALDFICLFQGVCCHDLDAF